MWQLQHAGPMIESLSHESARRAPRDRHCLIASHDAEAIAEISYHAVRLGLTVRTTTPDADLVAAASAHVPSLLVVSRDALATHGHALRRDVREATGHWGLGLVIVDDETATVARESVDVDAVIRRSAGRSAVAATLRRVVDLVAARSALADAPPIAVRREAREVRVHDRWLRLSDAEFRLFEALLRSPTGLSDVGIEKRMWGAPQRRGFRGLITVVARLRKKLVPLGVAVERAAPVRGYRLRW